MRAIKILSFLAAVSTAVFLYNVDSWAAAGDRDTSFGTDGIATINPTGGLDAFISLVLMPDNTVRAVGVSDAGAVDASPLLVSLENDGTLDAAFGTDGIVTDPATAEYEQFVDLVRLDNGQIMVLMALGHPEAGTGDVVLLRYNGSGSLDTSFGTDGQVVHEVTVNREVAQCMLLQDDGKILIGGSSFGDLLMMRVNADGSLDTDFSGDGILIADAGVSNDQVGRMALQDDGKIVFVGRYFGAGMLGRVTTDGQLDIDFDTDGLVINDLSDPGTTFNDVFILPNGQIMVAGRTDANVLLARFNEDGSLDNSFDDNGFTATDFGATDEGVSMIRQADGKFVIVGSSEDAVGEDWLIARFNSDGSLDNVASFGTDGSVIIDTGAALDRLFRVALQDDGKIVAAGFNGTDATVLRLLGDSADLQVTNTRDPETAAIGETITFTVTITNNGPDSVGGVTLTDTLPEALSLDSDSLSISQGSCSGTTTISCDIGTMANGDEVVLTYDVTVDAAGDLEGTVSVTAQAEETDSSNNNETVTVTTTEAESSAPGGGCSLVRR